MKKNLCITILLLVFVFITKQDLSANGKDFFENWKKLNFSEMYGEIDSISKTKITQKEFENKFIDFYGAVGGKNILVNFEEIENKEEYSYHVELNTIDGDIKFEGRVKKVYEGENEKIRWSDNLVFPELDEGYVVKVERDYGTRGEIRDRNNRPLAVNEVLYSIYLKNEEKEKINKKQKKNICDDLEIKLEELERMIKIAEPKKEKLLLKKIYGESNILKKSKENKFVFIEEKKVRYYPEKEISAHDIGYVQRVVFKDLGKIDKENIAVGDTIGKSGFEKTYDKKLRAIDGIKVLIEEKNGNIKRIVLSREKKNGENIKITTDIRIQRQLYKELGKEAGFAVVINPKTGELLGMASTPCFDNNKFITGFSSEEWKSLNENKGKPFFNKIQGRYSPGSTLKPVIAAIALENKTLTSEKAMKIRGLEWQNNKSWGKYFVKRVSEYDAPSNLINAMTYSDNIYFAKTAINLGKEKLIEGMQKFGIGEEIDSEYRLQKSQYSNNKDISSEIQLADTGYGQGQVLINPIHEALIYGAFINGGKLLKPIFEYKEQPRIEIWKEEVASKETISHLNTALRAVVKNPNGTGHSANIETMNIAGKTGTAEIKIDKNDIDGIELGWFAAFDIKKDNFVTVMMVQDVKNKGGSHYVVPKVRKIIEEIVKLDK